MTFSEWKREVDKELIKLCGKDSALLPNYYDYQWDFECKQPPKRTARRVIEGLQEILV